MHLYWCELIIAHPESKSRSLKNLRFTVISQFQSRREFHQIRSLRLTGLQTLRTTNSQQCFFVKKFGVRRWQNQRSRQGRLLARCKNPRKEAHAHAEKLEYRGCQIATCPEKARLVESFPFSICAKISATTSSHILTSNQAKSININCLQVNLRGVWKGKKQAFASERKGRLPRPRLHGVARACLESIRPPSSQLL